MNCDTKNGMSGDSLGQKIDPGLSFEAQINALGGEIKQLVQHVRGHCDVTRPSADCAYCRGAGARE